LLDDPIPRVDALVVEDDLEGLGRRGVLVGAAVPVNVGGGL